MLCPAAALTAQPNTTHIVETVHELLVQAVQEILNAWPHDLDPSQKDAILQSAVSLKTERIDTLQLFLQMHAFIDLLVDPKDRHFGREFETY
ncbi:hypothetical protein HDU98_003412, partial [Podochytrium sp. JEL0797]